MTEAVTVMLRAECELYVSDAGSPRLTWIYLFIMSSYTFICGSFPAARHPRSLADTKLYCLVTEAHVC